MPHSVYATLFKKTPETEARILFLKRSNGQWWLPGGQILPEHNHPTDAIRHWCSKLLSMQDWTPNEIGMWHLSPEVGGHEVRLYESRVEKPNELNVRDPNSNLSLSMGWFRGHQIHDHLYIQRDMPWGQAKMAVYCLASLFDGERRANGELLKDDLGRVHGILWDRPT